jgi:MoaA/NifB/PqqE/SkfB family radical SAM enzyme
MKQFKAAISDIILTSLSCGCKMAHRMWRMFPPTLRRKTFLRFGVPALRQLLTPLSREMKEQILRGEIVLSKEIVGLDGWYDVEYGPEGAFRWSGPVSKMRINLHNKTGFLQLDARYPENIGKRRMIFAGDASVVMDIQGGRRIYWVPIREILTESSTIEMRVEPVFRAASDPRELGIMVSSIRLLPDAVTYAGEVRPANPGAENLALNEIEWATGKAVLASSPPRLRIDLETRCNIKPPCVYCAFDYVKGREELSNHSFQPKTLIDMGPFFQNAKEVLDCSIGEPLMSSHFEALAVLLDTFGKRFDFTTNGQLLNGRLQELMLGRNMIVNVSLEATTAELYSLYRNDRFDLVIDNLSTLCRKKSKFHNLPLVIVAHLAMRSNVGKFEEFANLMSDVGVDAILIRSLNMPRGIHRQDTVRNGRRFSYSEEVLSFQELRAFVQKARIYTEKKGMKFHAELELGEFRARPSNVPICDEPWKKLYFFKRGIHPCCFGSRILFKPDEKGNLSTEEFLWQVWNSSSFQEIRSHLARGELAPYCLENQSCPIVQKRSCKVTENRR